MMAMICKSGGKECDGCMSCQVEKFVAHCPHCEEGIQVGDDVREYEDEFYHDDCFHDFIDEQFPRKEMQEN